MRREGKGDRGHAVCCSLQEDKAQVSARRRAASGLRTHRRDSRGHQADSARVRVKLRAETDEVVERGTERARSAEHGAASKKWR